MTNLRKAAELALEALEINLPIAYAKNGRGERFPCFSDDPLREIKTREAITALRQALERREQEPMAWIHRIIEDGKIAATHVNQVPPEKYDSWWESLPLYAAPPKRKWVGLTDDEMLALIAYEPHPLANRTAIINAVERLLKEKNHD